MRSSVRDVLSRFGLEAEELAGLNPNDDPAAVWEQLSAAPGVPVVCGHLPHLAKLAQLVHPEAELDAEAFPAGGGVRLAAATDWKAGPLSASSLNAA